MRYTITQSRLLYVLSINDRTHKGLLKIGEVFVDNEVADQANRQEWAKAVREVLDARPYMNGVKYNIEYVECTTYEQDTKCYKADDVYRTLHDMGISSKSLNTYRDPVMGNSEEADIWFAVSLCEIQNAIKLIKEGKGAGYGAIKFRPEQEKAISDTVDYFQKKFKDISKGKHYLWNAKMRFGKTLSGLEVARRCGFRSTLIITHRPVVDKGWHEDFEKIFRNEEALKDYKAQGLEPAYGRRMMDDSDSRGDFRSLIHDVDAGKKILVFFVSMQYLRLSQFVGGKEKHFDPLKRDIMQYNWDFVMVDEAHEGIDAAAGVHVMEKLKKDKTRILSLSGTPFNLLDKYEESEIYTWDYVMEQHAKQEWDEKHFGDPNPYAELPRMQILTFTLPKMVRDEAIENNEVFKFHEFFRVWTEEDKKALQNRIDSETDSVKRDDLKTQLAEVRVDKFIHEEAVRRFLDKLVEESDTSLYPFSTDEFREHFRHTFWLLPGVKEAAALEELLREHDVFGTDNGMFHIINAAGDGNIEDKNGSALAEVLNNIRGNAKENITKKDYTITLSCGKLTTGVSVPEWTAVLCMKGSENTPAANYMQTIFRVQTHAVLNGRQKSDCYVFDFAPDRALTAVAETAKMAVYAQTEGKKKQLKLSQKKEEEHLESFIRLCPVLSMDEGEMGRQISAGQIFEKLSNVYIERAVRSGYADNSLYNPEQLMNLTPEQEKALGDVHELLGSMPNIWKPERITINSQGIGNVDGAEGVKYIYYLSDKSAVPPTPRMSAESDDNDRPMTDTAGWDDVMNQPTQLFPYLFTSMARKDKGQWGDFSKPVLWRQWTEPDKDDEKSEAKKKRDEENKEKRARMSVLRGVSIRIPLLVYGAEINDEDGEEITVDNFASDIVDDASWEEFMPKGFTKQTFNMLKDCFDRAIFTGAAKRIRQMVKEADRLNTEDRIAKIATIFSYFHNPDKETVLTPWRVVNMQLSDTLGGWCFMNEQFDGDHLEENQYGELIHAARHVDRGDVTRDVFTDPNARILEINSKTGLYPLYMAYSVFKGAKEPQFRHIDLTHERGRSRDAEQYYRQAGDDLEIWKDVLQDNIFVVCRTPMAVSITKRTLAGFRKDVRMNVRCYERTLEIDGERRQCDMIEVLRRQPELFQQDVVQGHDFWHVYKAIPKNDNEDINNMKFKAIVGNPPYQNSTSNSDSIQAPPIYHHFVNTAKALKPDFVSLIIPSRWFAGGMGLDEFRSSFINDDSIQKYFDYSNSKDCFENISISGGVGYFLRNKSYHGLCEFTNQISGNKYVANRMLNQFPVIIRYNEAVPIVDKVLKENNSISTWISPISPFALSTKVRGNNVKQEGDVKLISSKGISYIKKSDVTKGHEWFGKYKVLISQTGAEHAMEPSKDGTFRVLTSTMQILDKEDVCTHSYILIGKFEDRKEAQNLLNYLKTCFVRFLILLCVSSIHISRATFTFVPLQDFTSSSDIDWTQSISNIDKQLYKKYNLSEDEIAFIEKMIKPMD